MAAMRPELKRTLELAARELRTVRLRSQLKLAHARLLNAKDFDNELLTSWGELSVELDKLLQLQLHDPGGELAELGTPRELTAQLNAELRELRELRAGGELE